MIRKILYVDDDLDSRAIVAAHLRFRGYEVLTVEEAEDALKLDGEAGLDAIILDVNLVGLDGPELMDALRREYPRVPVILYTGMTPETEKVKSMLVHGARECVSKNEPLDALVKAVHDALEPDHDLHST